MNQKETIGEINTILTLSGHNVSAIQIKLVLAAFEQAACRELAQGGEVLLLDMGKFCVVQRAARSGRNPATGEVIQIPAKRVVTFKAAKKLRDLFSG